jgi:hypothetical protein
LNILKLLSRYSQLNCEARFSNHFQEEHSPLQQGAFFISIASTVGAVPGLLFQRRSESYNIPGAEVIE